MVLLQNILEPRDNMLALLARQTVDMLYGPTDSEDALPACHRIGTDDRVNGPEVIADIVWRASGRIIELESCPVGYHLETTLLKSDCQCLEEFLVRGTSNDSKALSDLKFQLNPGFETIGRDAFSEQIRT